VERDLAFRRLRREIGRFVTELQRHAILLIRTSLFEVLILVHGGGVTEPEDAALRHRILGPVPPVVPAREVVAGDLHGGVALEQRKSY
jgi:hypothetical protein